MRLIHWCLPSPPLRLKSRKPLWRDPETIDVTSQWRDNWQLAMVVSSSLVADPTIRLSCFDLHWHQWSLLNRFRMGVTYRQLLSIDQVWWQTTASTWSRWGGRQLADNIWLLAYDNNNLGGDVLHNENITSVFAICLVYHVNPTQILSPFIKACKTHRGSLVAKNQRSILVAIFPVCLARCREI